MQMFEMLVNEARDIRFVIVKAGGMATKSAVEDVLMLRHSEIGRSEAHEVTNYIEQNNIDAFPMRRRFEMDIEPTIEDFPEIRNIRVPFLKLEN